jgi:hypothetical protein
LYSFGDIEHNVLIMKVRVNKAEVLTIKHAIKTGRKNSLMMESIFHTPKRNTHKLIQQEGK